MSISPVESACFDAARDIIDTSLSLDEALALQHDLHREKSKAYYMVDLHCIILDCYHPFVEYKLVCFMSDCDCLDFCVYNPQP